mgnify:CR=1 FL=1
MDCVGWRDAFGTLNFTPMRYVSLLSSPFVSRVVSSCGRRDCCKHSGRGAAPFFWMPASLPDDARRPLSPPLFLVSKAHGPCSIHPRTRPMSPRDARERGKEGEKGGTHQRGSRAGREEGCARERFVSPPESIKFLSTSQPQKNKTSADPYDTRATSHTHLTAKGRGCTHVLASSYG